MNQIKIEEESSLNFDPFRIPANIDLAKIHQVSSITNQKASMCGENEEKSDHCPCCGQHVQQKEISLCQNRLDLAFLGQGMPLFFEMTQQLTLLACVLFIILGIPCLITNIKNHDCIAEDNQFYQISLNGLCNENCPQNSTDFLSITKLTHSNECKTICAKILDICLETSVMQMSFANKQFDETSKFVQSILVLCSILVFKFAMIRIRISQRNTARVCDQEFVSPSDFTAMLTNLPRNEYNEAELKDALLDFCYQFDDKGRYEIIKIIIAYDITSFVQCSREKMCLEKKIEKIENYYKSYHRYPRSLKNNYLSSLKQRIIFLGEKLSRIESEVEKQQYAHQTQVAFVTFQTKEQLQSVLDQTKLSYWEGVWIRFKYYFINQQDRRGFYFKNRIIIFCRAPEPNDVFWENCGFNFQYQIQKRILNFFITIFILAASFTILLGLNILQSQNLSSFDDAIMIFVTLVISLIITVINQIIYHVIKLLGQSEKHFTKTHHDVSVATKLAIVQFFNSGIFTKVINILVYNFQNENPDAHAATYAYSRQGGVISDAFFLLIVNSFLVPIFAYLDPLYLYKLYQQYFFKVDNTFNQIEANRIFEGPSVLLYEHYSYVCLSLWISLLFAPLLPISLLFCSSGLLLYYWIQKYLLLRRNCKPPFQSFHLNREMMNLFELSPIILAVGQIWTDYIFSSSSIILTINFISLGFSCLELITPATRISKLFDRKDNLYTEKDRYQDVFLKLPTDYDRTNPLTQQNAILEFIKAKTLKDSNYKQPQVMDTKTALYKYIQTGGVQFMKNTVALKLKISMMRKIKLIRQARQLGAMALQQCDEEISQDQQEPIYTQAPEYIIVEFTYQFYS
ncbi:unnamed protein product (macronuclear) [Paramecium tetraurelia]|uniref:CSC1/OSCA1-like cytosolic domain-containing protein n=1 Tax=Paramecium tetraurelia TaxID=5888 RepID=A0CEC9_PARTE|nr:uncharacterized protein GSPATT00037583001 [Paramecium tetraurelia]CAK69146.1 unnamed protein product [Paramecium tetraurelia]|eukprot:XP_001436543.1 hypothetical protein (macronuclear) [Paramecium tetraurelia strain d4-2]